MDAEKRKVYQRTYYEKHREELLAKQKVRGKLHYQANSQKYRERSKRWKENNPERYRELAKFHYINNAERNKAKQKEWYQNNKERASKGNRARKLLKYGLTQEAFDNLLESQKGLCLICLRPPKGPSVDHDHKTGKVRGILCRICNAALGAFRDDPEALERARVYLSNSSSGAI